MKDQYKALAVNARNIALKYDSKMASEMSDGTGEQAEKYMKLAEHYREEAKVYDGAAARMEKSGEAL